MAMDGRFAGNVGAISSAPRSATDAKASKRFTAEERHAMNAPAQELKAEARANENRTEGEAQVLNGIAAMKEPDRTSVL